MEKSAGVVIIYKNKILLAHPTSSKRYHSVLSFPKGHIEKGESELQAALREVEEEVGIKLNRKQLGRKMHEIPYIAKKNKKGIPKGSIYKMVYYWTCHIEDLSEIGLTSEVVPKSQLQLEEVNWAGFVPANEIEKRIAPVMKSIIKHVNMNENNKFTVKNLDQFISEKRYVTKSDIKWNKKVEEFVKRDLSYAIRHALPYSWEESEQHIKSIEDKSIEDKGIKYEVTLKNNKVVTAYKTGKFAGDWEFYLDGKKAGRRGTRQELANLLYKDISDLDRYLLALRSYDWNYMYSDDHRAYKRGSNSSDSLVELYSKLTGREKRIAYAEFIKRAPKEHHVDFKEFGGL